MTFQHSLSGEKVEGQRLAPGDIIEATDLYDSVIGKWRPAGESFVGCQVKEDWGTVWVRPNGPDGLEDREVR